MGIKNYGIALENGDRITLGFHGQWKDNPLNFTLVVKDGEMYLIGPDPHWDEKLVPKVYKIDKSGKLQETDMKPKRAGPDGSSAVFTI